MITPTFGTSFTTVSTTPIGEIANPLKSQPMTFGLAMGRRFDPADFHHFTHVSPEGASVAGDGSLPCRRGRRHTDSYG